MMGQISSLTLFDFIFSMSLLLFDKHTQKKHNAVNNQSYINDNTMQDERKVVCNIVKAEGKHVASNAEY